jgi:uncharacterized protein (DUF1800 family)
MNNRVKIETVIAANRFGLGARPDDLAWIDKDPRAWLLAQLQGPSRPPSEFASLTGSHDILVELQEAREERQQAKKRDPANVADNNIVGRTIRRHYMAQSGARYGAAAATDSPFHERLVHFWSNHFAVSADKPPIPALAGAFENEAIRPNISGKFKDLLLAAEKHPAMLLYLDNQRSVGPNSDAVRRANRRRSNRKVGLNENLAREILELHTLGVNGGYTQADVTGFAGAITGWSIGSDSGRSKAGVPGKFHFRNEIHEPGAVKILNTRYAQRGVAQGETILADLARHPSTARHVAGKLARHFVADDPPADLVDSLARTFLDSGGDLPALHAGLVNAKEPWEQHFTKYKNPEDFVVSTFRAFNHVPDDARSVFSALEMMGQAPYRPGSPAGWPDTAAHWGGADGLYKRIEWSNTVARRVGRRSNPLELGEAVLGPALGDHTRTAISRAESLDQGLTLLLVSPEFQRR